MGNCRNKIFFFSRRYLAPEILDDSLDPGCFDAWKRADVYSLGLVLWEMARRTEEEDEEEDSSSGQVEEYRLPYFDSVGPDPGMEEMRRVVCEGGVRPQCPSRWERSEVWKEQYV